MPFFKSVEATGRQVVFSSLVHHPSGYEMNFEDIEHKIQEFNVKMVIFCSPHNPVGRVWRENELTRFVEIMNQNNVMIISDEIHMDFIFKGHKHIPLINFDEHVIMLMSASKTFNLASAHVSQIIVKSSSIRKKIMNLYHQLGLFHSVELGIRATTIAYQECDDYIDELCDEVAFIANGVIVAKDSPRQLKIDHGQKKVIVETKENHHLQKHFFDFNELSSPRFIELCQSNTIETIHSMETTLEDIFIKVTGVKLHDHD
jgi:bifunctional pyridoxal-dependent enzyme with beta-cystathionase and maltose regulon repressor activities